MSADNYGLPSTVQKRDGRLEPFEADKISQSLYAVYLNTQGAAPG